MNREEIEIQLWGYIDNTCTETERASIAALIENDALWRTAFDELFSFHSSIRLQLTTEQPSMRFTKNVMEAVATASVVPSGKKYINKVIVHGIAAFFIIVMLSAITYAAAIATHTPAKEMFRFSFNIADYLNSTFIEAFIMVNIVLALIFADTLIRKKMAKKAFFRNR